MVLAPDSGATAPGALPSAGGVPSALRTEVQGNAWELSLQSLAAAGHDWPLPGASRVLRVFARSTPAA
jgi:hypothetical protein